MAIHRLEHKKNIEDTREHRSNYFLEWRKNNVELKKQFDKDYYLRNEEHILCKYTCACGAIIANNSRLRHNKTQKHQTYLYRHAHDYSNIADNVKSFDFVPEGEEED